MSCGNPTKSDATFLINSVEIAAALAGFAMTIDIKGIATARKRASQ